MNTTDQGVKLSNLEGGPHCQFTLVSNQQSVRVIQQPEIAGKWLQQQCFCRFIADDIPGLKI